MKISFEGALLITVIGLTGCSSNTVVPDEYSGFLQDYSLLSQGKSPSGSVVLRWVDPGLDIAHFNSIYIEPSQFYPKALPTQRISQQTLNEITRYYDQALRRELSKSLPLAAGPGPGVIVMRPAITGVSSKTQGLKPYEIVPVALVAAAVSTASGIRDQEVDIATEANFIDGGSQRVVAQLVRKGVGRPLAGTTQNLTLENVKEVLDGWSSDLHESYLKLSQR